jgi:hypothetical protein
MSSDHLKTRLDGDGSCTTSSNSAINKRDKDKTAPLHAIMKCRRTGDEISLRFNVLRTAVDRAQSAASSHGGFTCGRKIARYLILKCEWAPSGMDI